MTTPATPACRWMYRFWIAATLVWLVFIAWRTATGWPIVPLDMGGTDPSRDAAYQAAQLQHVARALGLGLGGPVLGFIALKLACRAGRE